MSVFRDVCVFFSSEVFYRDQESNMFLNPDLFLIPFSFG